MKALCGVVVLAAISAAVAHAAEAEESTRDEHWWRAAMASREAELSAAEADALACEEREAPPAYDAVDGYVTRSASDGRPRYVEVRRCDDERAALAAARAAIERVEEEARRAGIPPGWLR